MAIYDILDLIWYFFAAFGLFPCLVCLIGWQSLPNQQRWLGKLCVALVLIDLSATLLRFGHIRNHFTYYFTTLVLLWFGAAIYKPVLSWGRGLGWLATLLTVAMIAEIGWVVGFNHINTVTLGIAWLLLAIYAFQALKRLLDQPAITSLRQGRQLYMHIGFLVAGFFLSGTKAMESYFIETSLDLYYFSDTVAIMSIAFAYVCFGFELVRPYQQSRRGI